MLTTRRATETDAELIAAHRYAMFAEMGKSESSVLDEMRRNFVPWVERMLATQKYVGWIVLDGERAVASGGFFELEWPPHPWDPLGEHRGYLLNFWVEPEYRGRGLARSLVKEAVAEARRRKLRVVTLHASDAGRPVYEAMGFRESNEMIWRDDYAR
jgi:ribosomal protein S18 acetylase RimI-like enzyme